MALTRDYKETVVARIKRDPKFAPALYAEALSALLDGETTGGLSMLCDLVHAEITFKELARQTGLGEKDPAPDAESQRQPHCAQPGRDCAEHRRRLGHQTACRGGRVPLSKYDGVNVILLRKVRP
jgi:hypothetical protein